MMGGLLLILNGPGAYLVSKEPCSCVKY